MDQLYSTTLLVALISGTMGVIAAGLLVLRIPEATNTRRLIAAAFTCSALALVFGAVSLFVHFRFGHGPNAPEPMSFSAFILFHKAYWFVAGLALLSFLATRVVRRPARG